MLTKFKAAFAKTSTRNRIYEVGIACAAAATVYGLTTGPKADALVAVLGAALGLARANTGGSDQ